jgi:hypothetical protein
MNKRFILIASLLFVLGAAAVLVFRWYAQSESRIEMNEKDLAAARKKAGMMPPPAALAPKPIPPSRSLRLAIGSLGLTDDSQNAQVADLLSAQLSGAKGLELIERQSLERVLREIEINLSGLVRAKDAVRAGKLLRADWFLLGTPLKTRNSNAVVLRIVDARTGIFRDTTVASADAGAEGLAKDLGAFVRRCRDEAAAAKSPIYLALGAFEDLSLNNRLAAFPDQLRAFLTTAYRATPITMLERDHVDTLLREMRLDLAGLTEESASRSPAAMQTAFWLVDGEYQTYEATRAEVELRLRISRIFGSQAKVTMREIVGEALFRSVKAQVDKALNERKAPVSPTRLSEAGAQLARAKELAPINPFSIESYERLTAQQARLRRRNTEEALRAFEAALLLDPRWREAKIGLAACYCKSTINRMEEGRHLYQEVLEEPKQDHWRDVAKRHLMSSFQWRDPEESFRWFSAAESQTVSADLRAFYHEQAESAKADVLMNGPDRTQGQAAAEQRLLQTVGSAEAALQGKPGKAFGGAYGMYEYTQWFGDDKAKAGRSLAAFLPRMIAGSPAMAPHLSAEALAFQKETNNAVLAEFQQQLEWCRAHPQQVLALNLFWSSARYAAYSWCVEHGEHRLAVDIMEGLMQAAQYTNSIVWGDQEKIALAFAYNGTGQWNEALAIFGSYSNLPVVMNSDGPWGRAFQPVLTAKEAAYCKEKIGIAVSVDVREFSMGTNCVCMHSPSAFAADAGGLWLAAGQWLVYLDFELHTNLFEVLPKDTMTGINCLLVGSSSVWIGSDGAGLFEFDKTSHRTIHYTEKEGLMSDIVSSLCLAGNTLWIGYGGRSGLTGYYVDRQGGGGLGTLDLIRHSFHAFAPSLQGDTDQFRNFRGPEPLDAPTRRAVRDIASDRRSDIWFCAASSPLRIFRQSSGRWEAFPAIPCSTLLADSEHVFVGGFWNSPGIPKSGALGVNIFSFADGRWSQLKDFAVLPSGKVCTLTVEGKYLWVAGSGYIAKIDPIQNELVKFAHVRSGTVEQVQIGGGFLWAQFDRHIHRARLP